MSWGYSQEEIDTIVNNIANRTIFSKDFIYKVIELLGEEGVNLMKGDE